MQNFFDILPEPTPTAVALGYFDGIHMGHKNVLSRAAYEKKNGLVSVCFTFSESPKSVLRGTQSEALMTNKEKLKMLDKLGIDHTYQADFKSIMNMSAQDFAEKILVNTLGAIIKNLIRDGQIKKANKMLCHRFGFSGVIEHGRQLGREFGTPTINQSLCSELVVPKFGVYCSAVTLENGNTYCGVTNIGVKPTVGSPTPLCETWMPKYCGEELYGQIADVRLIDFIRAERKFDTLDDLKNTIIDNGKTALKIFGNASD